MAEQQPNGPNTGPSGDWTPRPDPTVLTTSQLLREIASTNEKFDLEITALREIVMTRFDGMDKAIALIQAASDKMPSEVDVKVANLEAVTTERFRSVEQQFRERDVRTEQTSRDAKTAVDAALQAAKEAVGKQNDSFTLATSKSEGQFTKQIDQIGELLRTAIKALEDKVTDTRGLIADLKDRLAAAESRMTAAESRVIGSTVAHTGQQTSNSWALSLVMGAIGFVSLLILIGEKIAGK